MRPVRLLFAAACAASAASLGAPAPASASASEADAETVRCPDDVHLECPTGRPPSSSSDDDDGYLVVYRDPSRSCALPEDCPCPYEYRMCQNGDRRYRSGRRGCAFDACPEDDDWGRDWNGAVCDVDVRECRYESTGGVAGYVGRDPGRGCEFRSCEAPFVMGPSSEGVCPMWLCPNGDGTARVAKGRPERGCGPPPQCGGGLVAEDPKPPQQQQSQQQQHQQQVQHYSLRGHGRFEDGERDSRGHARVERPQ